MRMKLQIGTAVIIVSLTVAIANAQSYDAIDPDCPFCELSGSEYLNAIYEGDYDKQDRLAWEYLMEIRRNDTNDAMMGVFMQNAGLGSENLTVLQELLASYMQKYAYHDGRCLTSGAFERRVTWSTPDVVTTLNGWEFSRKEGVTFDSTYRLNKEFLQACAQLCGDAGSMTAAVNGLNMTRTRYSLMDVFEGLDKMFEQYSCSSAEIKTFERNMLSFFERENQIPSDGRRNTLLDVAFVPDEVPDPNRFNPDDRVFPGMSERQARETALADAERERGAIVLAENRIDENVQVTASGLQYVIVSPGSGARPTRSDSVTLHYRGETIDGTVFADTFSGEPVTLPLNAVIEGWAEGVTLIEPGGEIRLFIPPDLGYGDQAVPGIKPGSTLIFEVKLLGVE